MKNLLVDTRDLISAAIRFVVFVPIYKMVVKANRRVTVPVKIAGPALHGSRKARADLNETYSFFRDCYMR